MRLSFNNLSLRHSVAEVEVTIKNEGPEAYRPEVYGKAIIVSRRFTSEGSSSYKIQTANKKTVSNKRDELTAMCDHMQLQMDNPMNVLTQGLWHPIHFFIRMS